MESDSQLATQHLRRDAVWAAGAAVAFVAVTAALTAGGMLIELDLAVRAWAEAHRPGWAELVARVLNLLGQGAWFIVAGFVLAAWIGWRRGRRGTGWWPAIQPALYVFVAAALLAPTVLLLKAVTERGAPSSTLPPEQTAELFGPLPPGEYDAGFPGGHAANTIVWYGVLLALVITLLHEYGRGDPPRAVRVAVRVVPPVIVISASTYLSFHWITDGLAGLALGLALDRVLAMLGPYWWDTVPPVGSSTLNR